MGDEEEGQIRQTPACFPDLPLSPSLNPCHPHSISSVPTHSSEVICVFLYLVQPLDVTAFALFTSLTQEVEPLAVFTYVSTAKETS